MSHEFSQNDDQMEANEAILRQSELGIILVDAYIAATNVDPRLDDIAIISITDKDDPRPAFARGPQNGKNQTGRQEIHIRLDNLDETLETFRKMMEHTPKNTAIVAETLGLRPEDMTPQLMFIYSTLHEMGHALEDMDYAAAGKTHAEHMHDQKAERAKLPIGHLVASQLFNVDSPKRQYVAENWETASQLASENYSAFTGEQVEISTIAELIDATAHVHRKTKFEAAADNFAATVLLTQPVMVQQLTGDITRFRNYPQNAGYGVAV